MTIKLLQLNINSDNYWDRLIPFLTINDFDILHLQELTGEATISGNINSQRNCYKELQKILSPKYKSELAISHRFSSSLTSYMANATFYKSAFTLKEKNILTLHGRNEPFPSELNTFESAGRNVLHLTLSLEGKQLACLNAHLAWAKTPKEEPHQTGQGEILVRYLQTVNHPFILTGDFNLDPQQPTIQKLNKLARNLIEENHVTNTLNPRTHRAKNLFPQGVAVDYIFTSSELQVKSFAVVEEDISDHLGLKTEIEI